LVQCAFDRHLHFCRLLCRQHCAIAGLSQNPVNEFYKKGCQEKTYASTGGRVRGLDLQPTGYVSAPDRSGFLLWTVCPSHGFLCQVARGRPGRLSGTKPGRPH
jgi:hypothetical protein